jgi:hypothetical protein
MDRNEDLRHLADHHLRGTPRFMQDIQQELDGNPAAHTERDTDESQGPGAN